MTAWIRSNYESRQPDLASFYGASAADVQLLGPAAGRLAAKLVRPLRLLQGTGATALAGVGGVNIHAAVAVDGSGMSVGRAGK